MTILKWVTIALAIVIIYLATLSWSTRQHPIKGEKDRTIKPCPGKPNCVSSIDTRPDHRLEPFPILSSGPDSSWDTLMQTVEQSGGEILINDGRYCHAVFTSALFRFRDDFEASLGEDHIDIRSASRAGTSDLGANRKRIKAIRARYRMESN